MVELANRNVCTGCGACAYVCPKHCISMKENDYGVIYPVVNDIECVGCNKCRSFCPILNEVQSKYPLKVYAAWSSDIDERRTSASGGVATEVYKEGLKEGFKIAGAAFNEDFSVSMKIGNSLASICNFKNSKYVFSDAYKLYPQVRDALKARNKVIVIGLSCQIAALRRIFKNDSNLLLIDLVCHGTTPLYICNSIFVI